MRLKDKIALITGSARGIGQATAELFHKEGAVVILSDIRDKEGKEIEHGIPMGHFGEALDVAHGIIYLASDESKYVTGIELSIDGGILAGSEAKPQNQ